MSKRLLLYIMMTICVSAVSIPTFAQSEHHENVSTEMNAVSIAANANSFQVRNASGQTLEVYDLTGKCVARFNIDSADKTVNHNLNRGVYICKIGSVVRKVKVQ